MASITSQGNFEDGLNPISSELFATSKGEVSKTGMHIPDLDIIDGYNIMPTIGGYTSFFGKNSNIGVEVITDNVQEIISYRTFSGNTIAIAFCDNGLWVKSLAGDDSGSSTVGDDGTTITITLDQSRLGWTKVLTSTPSGPFKLWTWGILKNKFYMYQGGLGSILRIDGARFNVIEIVRLNPTYIIGTGKRNTIELTIEDDSDQPAGGTYKEFTYLLDGVAQSVTNVPLTGPAGVSQAPNNWENLATTQGFAVSKEELSRTNTDFVVQASSVNIEAAAEADPSATACPVLSKYAFVPTTESIRYYNNRGFDYDTTITLADGLGNSVSRSYTMPVGIEDAHKAWFDVWQLLLDDWYNDIFLTTGTQLKIVSYGGGGSYGPSFIMESDIALISYNASDPLNEAKLLTSFTSSRFSVNVPIQIKEVPSLGLAFDENPYLENQVFQLRIPIADLNVIPTTGYLRVYYPEFPWEQHTFIQIDADGVKNIETIIGEAFLLSGAFGTAAVSKGFEEPGNGYRYYYAHQDYQSGTAGSFPVFSFCFENFNIFTGSFYTKQFYDGIIKDTSIYARGNTILFEESNYYKTASGICVDVEASFNGPESSITEATFVNNKLQLTGFNYGDSTILEIIYKTLNGDIILVENVSVFYEDYPNIDDALNADVRYTNVDLIDPGRCLVNYRITLSISQYDGADTPTTATDKDGTTLLTVSPIDSEDDPLADVVGIFTARDRLGAWKNTNRIHWSSVVDPVDFLPSKTTQANELSVNAIQGNIAFILGYHDGFVIYSTGNVVRGEYVGGQFIYDFKAIKEAGGCIDPRHVTGNLANHYYWSNDGLTAIMPMQEKAEKLQEELTDWLNTFRYPLNLRLTSRYLIIGLQYDAETFEYRRQRINPNPSSVARGLANRGDISANDTFFPVVLYGANLYPTYKRALVYDTLLEKWGTLDSDHKLLWSLNPINQEGFPIEKNYLLRDAYLHTELRGLAILDDSNLNWVANTKPTDSYILFGKYATHRYKMTKLVDVFTEFSRLPENTILQVERTLEDEDIYDTTEQSISEDIQVRSNFNLGGRWFNIIVRGTQYHLKRLMARGYNYGR